MKKIILTLGCCLVALAAVAQQEIRYEVRFPNLVHHEAEISMTIPNVPRQPLKVRMSRSSPGRYATHEFGKNIYHFKAVDAQGNALAVSQPEGDVYVITAPSSTVKITYTLFGNWIDGTYAGFDETHAHMNIPATFAYPLGMDSRPRLVTFELAGKDWKVATQLKPMGNNTYYARDFQYFMDSPTEISAYKTASFSIRNPNGKTQTIHLVSHSDDEQATIDQYAVMLKRMVEEHQAVWGELPDFDYGHYYFLHDVHPSYAGDGMEHRNSTSVVQRTPRIAGYENMLLGTFSHEFFHSWNVERFRPKGLEPFNFERSNVTEGLWMAEGFTQYYGNLLLARAGFRTPENAIATFNGLVNTVLNTPGAKNFSPIQASRYAVFADAGVAIDLTNKQNIFTSYYTYGAAVALALDLRLRSEFKLTLDDYMRALWKAYGKTETPYSMADLEKTLASLTKNPAFAANFFKNYVHGTGKEDYERLLAHAGLILRKASPGKAYTGFGRITFENGKASLGQTTIGTPAYSAGLDLDDILVSIDGTEIKDQASLNQVIDARRPGDQLTVAFTRNGVAKTTQLVLGENPALEIVTVEKTGGTLSPEMQRFRDRWLQTQVKP